VMSKALLLYGCFTRWGLEVEEVLHSVVCRQVLLLKTQIIDHQILTRIKEEKTVLWCSFDVTFHGWWCIGHVVWGDDKHPWK
jgi:hypothetical protein